MSRINVARRYHPHPVTHEGAPARVITPEQALRRSLLSCLLWEDEFYEDGQEIASRILALAREVPKDRVAALAVEARSRFNLRHAPLLLLRALAARGGIGVDRAFYDTIQRPDELAEVLAIYWKDGKKPIPKQMKRGLAWAFEKFDEYQLAKWDRNDAIKLRDVMFLVHPKPQTPEREALYQRLASGTLATPDTWEVALSGGEDKREAFTRLLESGKLGYLALLRNLRNMTQAGVDPSLIRAAILLRKGADRVLPFRYIAAARACPQMEPALDVALLASLDGLPQLPGRTLVLVDVSGSMEQKLSGKSDLTRMDAAAALAAVFPGDVRVFSFSAGSIRGWVWGERSSTPVLVEVPPRRGMAGIDAVIRSQEHGNTLLGQAVEEANAIPHDRLVVITDEQSRNPVPAPMAPRAYMVNVASNRNGVGYGSKWTHLDGFSENVLRFIWEVEAA